MLNSVRKECDEQRELKGQCGWTREKKGTEAPAEDEEEAWRLDNAGTCGPPQGIFILCQKNKKSFISIKQGG